MPQVSDEELLKGFMRANSNSQGAVFGNRTAPILGAIHVVDFPGCRQLLCPYAQVIDHSFIQEAFRCAAVKQHFFCWPFRMWIQR
jgi:hypothetical protein